MSAVDAKPFAINSTPCAITLTLSPSLRGASRRSNPALFWLDGLLRRFAPRNDEFKHVHATTVVAVAVAAVAVAAAAVAGSRRSCAAWQAQSPRAARRGRRYGWRE